MLGYQNSASGTITALKSIEVNDNGQWTIEHIENCTHRETVDGVTRDVEHFCEYYYTYHIDPKAPEQLIVSIQSFDYEDPKYAISAGSEQEALELYENFTTE